jgi:hypothetical protein
VQNADDSSYKKLPRPGGRPYLRFEITPHAFVVETNEDGFMRSNVEAICATGKSSKKVLESDNHIGEKGFGFKSVFSVADHVKIQSGLWSFRFKHRRGEDGLGMVTPLDASPEVLPADVVTRLTLRYSKEAKQDYSRLVDAVNELPNTMIMFLQQLQTIHINITGLNGQRQRTTYTKKYSKSQKDQKQCTVTTSKHNGDGAEEDRCTYLLFSKVQDQLPAHELRKNRTKAKIEIAFPIDSTTQQPQLSERGQHVFAYLPLQRVPQIQVSRHTLLRSHTNHKSAVLDSIRFRRLRQPRNLGGLQMEP